MFLLRHRFGSSSVLGAELSRYHVLLLAALQRPIGCRASCERYINEFETDASQSFYVKAVSEMLLDPDELAGPIDTMLKDLERLPSDAPLMLKAAQALCVASTLAETRAPDQSHRYLEKANELLQQYRSAGDQTEGIEPFLQEPDFKPLWNHTDLTQMATGNQGQRQYSGILLADDRYESTSLYDLSPAEHLEESKRLIEQGYSPDKVVLLECSDKALIAASVWKRPLVPQEDNCLYARQQARLILLLLRLGHVGDALSAPASTIRSNRDQQHHCED